MSQLQYFFLRQVILIFSIIQFKPARYENYVFPPWAQGVGWVIAMASIIWIPVGTIHTLWVLPGSLMQVMCIHHFLVCPLFACNTHVHAVLYTVKSSCVLILLVKFSNRNSSCPSHQVRWMRCQKCHITRGEEHVDIQV